MNLLFFIMLATIAIGVCAAAGYAWGFAHGSDDGFEAGVQYSEADDVADIRWQVTASRETLTGKGNAS